jgi:hypothetical protein
MRSLNRISLSLFLVAAIFASIAAAQEHVPDWVDSYSSTEKSFVTVGEGEGRLEALVNAMVQLAEAIKTHVISDEKHSIHFARLSMGHFKIQSTRTQHLEQEPDAKGKVEDKEINEAVMRLEYARGNKRVSATLSYSNVFNSDGSIGCLKNDFQVSRENCSVSELIRALESLGCRFEFHAGSDRHHAKVEIDREKIEKL